MEQLLLREQKKFVTPLKEKSPPDQPQPEWDRLYSPGEQIARIAQRVNDDDFSLPDPALPPWLGPEYRENLKRFVPQHPFLGKDDFAGPAFRDYVLGVTLADEENAVYAELVLDRVGFVPTPLFAGFYSRALMAPGSGSHAGYLYESAISQLSLDNAALSAHVSPEEGNGAHRLIVLAEDRKADSSLLLDIVLLVDGQNPLTFRRRLRNASLIVEGPLEFHSPGGDFELVDVEAVATELRLNAMRLVVNTYTRHQRVLLEAGKLTSYGHFIQLAVNGEGQFKLNWPGANHYPWASYHDSTIFHEPADRNGVMLALRRILKWFRRDKRDEFAKKADFIDNVVLGRHVTRNPLREALFHYLVERGILELQGSMYVMHEDAARGAGLNWRDLRETAPPKGLVPFIDSFLRQYAEQGAG
jgi:hypothetical protein